MFVQSSIAYDYITQKRGMVHNILLLPTAAHARFLDRAVLLRRVDEEIADTARVAPLVVVPSDELDEVLVERNASLGIEDRGGRVAGEVSRDNLLLGVRHDASHGASGGLLDGSLDLVVRRRLLETDDKVDDGDIEGGDTEGETSELAVEGGDDLADSLGGTGRGGDDVVGDSTATTPVLHRRAIDGTLGSGGSVDSGHETLNDTELVVDDLGEGSQAVGRARRVGDLCGGKECVRSSGRRAAEVVRDLRLGTWSRRRRG